MDDVYRMQSRQRDRTLIKVNIALEVRYWAATLRCTEPQLRAAINAVGPGADAVRTQLTGVRVV